LGQGQLQVTDLTTGEVQIAKRTTKKYRISLTGRKAKYRYFEQSTIDNYFRRKAIEQLPEHIRNKRPNVEATIRHVFCTLDGGKSKYRGKVANTWFVYLRSFWVNFVRIVNYEESKTRNALAMAAEKAQETAQTLGLALFSAFIALRWLLQRVGGKPARSTSFSPTALGLGRRLSLTAS
jgi:hypothetical protein